MLAKIQRGPGSRSLRRSVIGVLVLLVVAAALGWFYRATPDERLLRRWLSAQAEGVIPGALSQDVVRAPLSFRTLAAQELGRHESRVTTLWREIRSRLPRPARARAPLPFSTGRRGFALLNLVDKYEHEPPVTSALLAVATNRHAANRRLALLALGRLPLLPPVVAEPLASLADDPDHLVRLDAAITLRLARPRTRTVELALQRLAVDPVPGVRDSATNDLFDAFAP